MAAYLKILLRIGGWLLVLNLNTVELHVPGRWLPGSVWPLG